MQTVLLILHLFLAAGLVLVVLLQRSEGGALGIGGGGGGGGGFLTGRGTANLLTRVTAGLAAGFFVTSLTLTILAQGHSTAPAVIGRGATTTPANAPAVPADPTAPPAPPASGDNTPAAGVPAAPPASGGILDRLNKGQPVPPQSK